MTARAGRSALSAAAGGGHYAVVKDLLDRGASASAAQNRRILAISVLTRAHFSDICLNKGEF